MEGEKIESCSSSRLVLSMSMMMMMMMMMMDCDTCLNDDVYGVDSTVAWKDDETPSRSVWLDVEEHCFLNR